MVTTTLGKSPEAGTKVSGKKIYWIAIVAIALFIAVSFALRRQQQQEVSNATPPTPQQTEVGTVNEQGAGMNQSTSAPAINSTRNPAEDINRTDTNRTGTKRSTDTKR